MGFSPLSHHVDLIGAQSSRSWCVRSLREVMVYYEFARKSTQGWKLYKGFWNFFEEWWKHLALMLENARVSHLYGWFIMMVELIWWYRKYVYKHVLLLYIFMCVQESTICLFLVCTPYCGFGLKNIGLHKILVEKGSPRWYFYRPSPWEVIC